VRESKVEQGLNTIKLSVTIDKGACVGTGLCVSSVDELFRFDGEGLGETYGAVEGYSEEQLLAFAELCPVSAILVRKE
jgi:ferredoxin